MCSLPTPDAEAAPPEKLAETIECNNAFLRAMKPHLEQPEAGYVGYQLPSFERWQAGYWGGNYPRLQVRGAQAERHTCWSVVRGGCGKIPTLPAPLLPFRTGHQGEVRSSGSLLEALHCAARSGDGRQRQRQQRRKRGDGRVQGRAAAAAALSPSVLLRNHFTTSLLLVLHAPKGN